MKLGLYNIIKNLRRLCRPLNVIDAIYAAYNMRYVNQIVMISDQNPLKPKKSLKDQVRFRRSSSGMQRLENPSVEGSSNHGFVDFMHEYLFLNESISDGWNFVSENSMKFSFR